MPVWSYLCKLGRHRLCQNPKCECPCHDKEEAPPTAQTWIVTSPEETSGD
jgi:hypothetical protein